MREDKTVTGWSRIKTAKLTALITMIIVGILFSRWVITRSDNEMRERLLEQVHLVKQAINPEDLKKLSGSKADLNSPVYLHIKEQLAKTKISNPKFQFIYLMGKNNQGEVFFYVDNEPMGSADESPAGQVFDEASAEIVQSFETMNDVVEGPVKDRWGVWVSALVPITDPVTGELLAMLGVDVDASKWRVDVVSDSALLIGMMVALIIVLTTWMIATCFADKGTVKPIQYRLMLPLTCMLLLLITGFGAPMLYMQNNNLNQASQEKMEAAQYELEDFLKIQTHILTALEEVMLNDEHLIGKLKTQDAALLLDSYRPLFNKMKEEQGVTHFYFHNAERINIVRLHQPDRNGDLIDRFTALEAERTGAVSSGFELGPLGTYTLRVVHPVVGENAIIGYIELGKEIEYILKEIRNKHGIEIAATVRKKMLDQEAFETGMRMLGRDSDWDLFENELLIYSSLPQFPEDAVHNVDETGHIHGNIDTVLRFSGSTWRIMINPLIDAGGTEVGDLILFHDTTESISQFRRIMMVSFASALVLLTALFGFLFVLLKRVDTGIQTQQSELNEIRQAVDASSNAIAIATADGHHFYQNETFTRMFGYALEEFEQLAPVDTYADKNVGKQVFDTIMAGGSCDAEVEMLSKDGRQFPVHLFANAVKDKAGEVISLIGVHTDISERKQAEEDHRKLSLAIEQSPATIVITNTRGSIEYVNPAFTRTSGYTPEEAIGQNPRIINSGLHTKEFYEDLWVTILAGNVWRGEIHNRRKNEELYWEAVSISPVKDENGTVTHFISVKEDITDRKNMELRNTLFNTLKTDLMAPGNLDGMMKKATDAVLEMVQADFVRIWLLDEGGQCEECVYAEEEEAYRCQQHERCLHLVASSGRYTHTDGDHARVPYGSGKNGLIAAGKEGSYVSNSIATDPLVRDHLWAETLGLKAFAGYQLRDAHGVTIGVMALFSANEVDTHIDKFLLSVANTVSQVIIAKRAESAVLEAKKRMETILHSIQSGILVIDAQTHTIIDTNTAALNMIGAERDEVVGAVCHQYICTPGENECPITDKNLRIDNREVALLKKGGGEVSILKTVVPIELEGRRCLLESFVDITERKKMYAQLRESEETFRAISDSAQDAIVMIDNEGRITRWNYAAERIFQYRSEEVLGRILHDFLIPERFKSAHYEAFPTFRNTGKGNAVGKTLELAAVRKDGRELEIELALSAVHLQGGWHAVGIMRDITERKQALKVIQEAKEAAESAARAKTEFLANMSHEIRTPMNGVIGMTGLLMDTELNADQRQYAETIKSSGDSLLTVINDILDFSKIEAGKLDLEMLDFDLRTALEQMNDALAIKAQEKGIEYVSLVDPDVPSFLVGDPGRVRQILTNLIGNAVKFTQSGEIKVHTGLEEENGNRVKLRFSVSDTGIGISQDRLDGLFEAFTQADASTTRRYGGTGLGLSISKQLSEMMGGEIAASSEEGKGSTFWFTAEFEKQEEGKTPTPIILEDIRGKRILVVDDNETNRLVVRQQLQSWGCRHDEAPGGKEALEKLKAAKKDGDTFQIAILDMQMPEMDGEMLCHAIKQDPEIEDTPLVMMTSIGQRGDAARLHEIGFSAYLTKPVKQSQLYDCLASVLSQALTQEAARSRPLVTKHTIAEEKRRKIRILMAEDNITNQQVGQAILLKLGYRADAVANGEEAIKALELIPYDIVLMDCQMPVMDGYETTAYIRNPKSKVLNHEVPIIAMTAHAMQGDREKCLEVGMNDYVSKPVNPQELANALERQLDDEVLDARPESATPAQQMAAAPLGSDAKASAIDFDETALAERFDGDKDLIKTVLEVFIEDAPRQFDVLDKAIQENDAPTARMQAHSLKGAAGNVGAIKLSELSLQAENAGEEGDLKQAAVILQDIRQAFDELTVILTEQYLADAST